jgi:transposase-like protein
VGADLPAGDHPVTLVWVKRIWRCTHPECEQQTWTEAHRQIRARASWSERARQQACRRVGRDGHSVAAVARDVGVGWATVMAAVIDYGTALIEHPGRIEEVAAVGVDETAFARARPGRSTVFATGIVDLHRGKLIDIIPGRTASGNLLGCSLHLGGHGRPVPVCPLMSHPACDNCRRRSFPGGVCPPIREKVRVDRLCPYWFRVEPYEADLSL